MRASLYITDVNTLKHTVSTLLSVLTPALQTLCIWKFFCWERPTAALSPALTSTEPQLLTEQCHTVLLHGPTPSGPLLPAAHLISTQGVKEAGSRPDTPYFLEKQENRGECKRNHPQPWVSLCQGEEWTESSCFKILSF